jgi:hypothetical protein
VGDGLVKVLLPVRHVARCLVYVTIFCGERGHFFTASGIRSVLMIDLRVQRAR